VVLFLVLAAGCASAPEPPPYPHNRTDYRAFQLRHPEILEPNYLPFMTYRVAAPSAPGARAWRALRRALGRPAPEPERLVFCRWAEGDLPLRVFIKPPAFGPEWADALRPVRPEPYVEAVEQALAIWQRDLDEVIRFSRVPRSRYADINIELVAEEAPFPNPDIEVLGSTHLRNACQVLGKGPAEDRLRVRYRVRDLTIFVVDAHGALLPDQVEKVALHELGHALGMPGHSPIPADLMYPEARDRITRDGLGIEDVNSFLSLYALPSGTIYLDPAKSRSRPPARPDLPSGKPVLSLAPYVDSRLGFEVQTPRSWVRIPTRYGLAVVNGVAWDYEASIQVNVFRYDTVDEYLGRYGSAYLAGGAVLEQREVTKAGRHGLQILRHTRHQTSELLTFLESGDGRVLVAIDECPLDLESDYTPWFDAVLDSLEVVAEPTRRNPRRSRDRDYSPGGG